MPRPHQLPGPNVDFWDWQLQALCRGEDSSIFFSDNHRGHVRARREAQAKRICGRCPVVWQCRDHALAVGERYGVWGGLSASERASLLFRQAQHRSTSERKFSPQRAVHP